MRLIKLRNQLEGFIAIAIKNGTSSVGGLFSLLSSFSKENIASTLASMNNKAILIIQDDGQIEMDPLAIQAYEIIGNGLEADGYFGSTKSYEMSKFIFEKYGNNNQELIDVIDLLELRLVEIDDEQR